MLLHCEASARPFTVQCNVFKPKRRRGGGVQTSPFYSGRLKLDSWAKSKTYALQTTDKRIAELKLREIALEEEKVAMGLLPPRAVRNAHLRPLAGLLEDFLADLAARRRTAGTIRKYGGTLRLAIERLGWTELRCVTVRSFVQWRNLSGLSPKTLNDLLANLCTFFRWLEVQGLAQANPLEHVARVDTRGLPQCRRALSVDEVQRLLRVAPRERAIVYYVALQTGMRRRELNAARWADFALEDKAPTFFIAASDQKNRTDARLPMGPELVAVLRAYRPRDFSPFERPFWHRVPRISSFRRDLAAAGIPLLDEKGRRVDFHSLRVTFATLLLANGVHPSVAQQLMRHSDIRLTTRLYTDATQLPLAAGVAKLPAFTQRNWGGSDTQKDTQVAVADGRASSSSGASGRAREILQSA